MADTIMPNIFTDAYINDPRMISEIILNNEVLGGTLTFPVISEDETEEPKIYTIPFYLEENFSFSLGNEWKPLIDASLTSFFSQMYNLSAFANGEGQLSMINQQMQAASWQGSQTPEFQITTTFVATRRDYNPTKIIKALAATCLPLKPSTKYNPTFTKNRDKLADGTTKYSAQFGDKITEAGFSELGSTITSSGEFIATAIKNTGLAAPLYYSAKFGKDSVDAPQHSTVTLRVGKWFMAQKLLVKSISNIQFSKEVVAPPPDFAYHYKEEDSKISVLNNIKNVGQKDEVEWGFPLYAKCTITLTPITMITASEFQSYFIQCPTKSKNKLEKSTSVLTKELLTQTSGGEGSIDTLPETIKNQVDSATSLPGSIFNPISGE